MTEIELSLFLDLGWTQEAELFYNGHIYVCAEVCAEGEYRFEVYRQKAIKTDDIYYQFYVDKDNNEIDFDYVFTSYGTSREIAKRDFLEAKIFDGKSFWEVESEIEWLELDEPCSRLYDEK